MYELTVIVPTKDNDGKRLDRQRVRIEYELAQAAGGWTREIVRGAWISETGKLYRDVSHRYTVACDAKQAHVLTTRASYWAEILRQECVYVSVREAQMSFVAPMQKAS